MKHLRTLLAILLLSATLVQAEEKEGKALPETSTQHSLSQITPGAGPRVKEGLDIALFADFIYWNTSLDTLTYAKTGFGVDPSAPHLKHGKIQPVNWGWDPGFKIGINWNFPHGCWDMILQYTWLDAQATGTTNSSTIACGFPTFFPTNHMEPIQRAHAHFDLTYQLADLEIGRNYYVSRTLKLRPFVGLKGTWQRQNYDVSYISHTQKQFYDYHVTFDHKLWGLGARGGIHSSWHFSKVFSLYGNLALSSMWLNYDTSRKDSFAASDQPALDNVAIQGSPNLIKPVLECDIGLRAETYYSNGRYHILGLTAKVRFDF